MPKDNVLHFISLSFLISYIKLYKPIVFCNKKKNLFMFIILFSFMFFIVVSAYFLVRVNFISMKIADSIANKITRIFSIPVIFTSLFLFLFFTEVTIKYNKIINLIASTTFGVYLFHENVLINRSIYHFVFKADTFISSRFLILYLLLLVICMYVLGIIYDLIRKNTFDKLFLMLCNIKKSNKLLKS